MVRRTLDEANDDDLQKVLAFVLKRLNQSKFKKIMNELYQNKCAISGIVIPVLFEAAHIKAYSESGNNSNFNGILLRNDLHRLFDAGLLRIEPDSLEISIDNSLSDTDYQNFDGKKLAKRSDGSDINREHLVERWNRK